MNQKGFAPIVTWYLKFFAYYFFMCILPSVVAVVVLSLFIRVLGREPGYEMSGLGLPAVASFLILIIGIPLVLIFHIFSIFYISRHLHEDKKKIAILVGLSGLIIFIILPIIYSYYAWSIVGPDPFKLLLDQILSTFRFSVN